MPWQRGRFGRETPDSFKLRQEDLALEIVHEIRPFQRVHHRPLDLGQVEHDPGRTEAVSDGFKTFQGTGVDGVPSGTHQDNVVERKVVGDAVMDRILPRAGIREMRAFVHPDG